MGTQQWRHAAFAAAGAVLLLHIFNKYGDVHHRTTQNDAISGQPSPVTSTANPVGLCPNNCHADQGFGRCEAGRCICALGHDGQDCASRLVHVCGDLQSERPDELKSPTVVKYDLRHLTQPENQNVVGPVQDDEALFMYSIIRGRRLKIIFEI